MMDVNKIMHDSENSLMMLGVYYVDSYSYEYSYDFNYSNWELICG